MNFAEPLIREWVYEPPRGPPQEAKDLVFNNEAPELFHWGYGTGMSTLLDVQHSKTAKNRMLARRVVRDDKPIIEVDLRRDDEGVDRLIATYVLDPARGFLVTSGKYFEKNGQIRRQFSVGAREIAPGTWIPSSVEDVAVAPKKWKVQLEVTDVSILEPNVSNFELSSLKPTEGAHVMHIAKDGQIDGYVVRDGKAIPAEVDAQLRK